jgi:regulator of cell morphogenesis and NO signaling
LAGAPLSRHSIKAYAAHHDSVATRLKELKDIIVRYIPQKNSDLMISVLYDIITCEQDLTSHCRVEDQIMVPLALRLEEVAAERAADVNDDDEPEQAVEVDQLSQREKEIIACVARGLSNKEIADTLCLSVHTVTTHRRNISAKLQIHSPAGLTIYAIINHLVNLDQIHSIK